MGYRICRIIHDGTVNLTGPGKERDKKLAWIQGSALCPECQKGHTRKVNAEMELVVDIRLNTIGNFLALSLNEEFFISDTKKACEPLPACK